MATSSAIQGSRRSRRRLVAAAIGLCALTAAAFGLVQAPLKAKSQARVVVGFDGQRYPIRAQDIEANANPDVSNQSYRTLDDKGNRRDVTVGSAVTLEQLLALDPGIPQAVKSVDLPLDNNGVLFANANDPNIIFFVDGQDIRWLRKQADSQDPNAADQGGTSTADSTLPLHGHAGRALQVSVTATPSTGVRAGDTVNFEANVKDAPQALTYSWDFGDQKKAETSTGSADHVYDARVKNALITVTVKVDKDSRGAGTVVLNVKPKLQSGGGTGSGGSGTGTGGNGSSGGVGGGTGTGPSYTPSPGGSTTSPALPAPTTPPPATTTPSNPDLGTPTPLAEPGQTVEGILVSAPAPANQAGKSGKSATAKEPKQQSSSGVDWKVPSGAILAGLLLILGALREHMPTRRLLSHAS